MSVCGIAVLICIVMLRLFPEIITLTIAFDAEYKEWSLRKGLFVALAAVSGAFNFAVYFLLHFKILHSWNIAETILDIAGLRVFYQNCTYFSNSFLACTIAAAVMGIMLRCFLRSLLGSTYGQGGYCAQSKAVLLLLISVTAAGAIAGYGIKRSGASKLVINEICSNNTRIFWNENQEAGGYVELYNDGWLPYWVEGAYLSDDADELEKYEIPLNILYPKEYQLIALDENAPFQIADSGETLFLSAGG